MRDAGGEEGRLPRVDKRVRVGLHVARFFRFCKSTYVETHLVLNLVVAFPGLRQPASRRTLTQILSPRDAAVQARMAT